jgi:hypothetical protein
MPMTRSPLEAAFSDRALTLAGTHAMLKFERGAGVRSVPMRRPTKEATMKGGLLAMMLVLAAASAAATAQDGGKAPGTQQERMKMCNDRASGMKGDERKTFMSECLSGKQPEAKLTQQERMKMCNERATGMKGDERKKFLSACLKG